MRALLTVLVLLGMGCATAPIVATPVFPFGPDTFTTTASTAVELPNQVREQVIAEASAFCRTRGERSLPVDINLISTPPQSYSNATVHSVTMVFRCFDPGRSDESKSQI